MVARVLPRLVFGALIAWLGFMFGLLLWHSPSSSPPDGEWRCLSSDAYVVGDRGSLWRVGEVATCGYGLVQTGTIGPSIETWVEKNALVFQPVGTPEQEAPGAD